MKTRHIIMQETAQVGLVSALDEEQAQARGITKFGSDFVANIRGRLA